MPIPVFYGTPQSLFAGDDHDGDDAEDVARHVRALRDHAPAAEQRTTEVVMDRRFINGCLAIVRGEACADAEDAIIELQQAGHIKASSMSAANVRAAAERVLASAGMGSQDRLSLSKVEEIRERFGTTRPKSVHWERNSLVLPATMTKEQARQILARHGGTIGGKERLYPWSRK